ncbi:MAG TPA: chalcone isomerase family protein [Burkholderiales bacterium]|nr:chalcone isomerase family protein [Burkholderiales bacterium]
MTKHFFSALMFAGVALWSPVHAFEIEGVKIDDKATLTKGGAELVLNGAGVRHKFGFMKVYIGSLYLTQRKTENEAIFADPGPKRITMHILASEVTAQDLIASMNHALAANLVPHELALLEKRIRDLNAMMSSLKVINKGGVIQLDYIPGVGTRVTDNGADKLTIPGDDFFRALLHIWIGDKPVDGRLRDAMLGRPSRLF